MRKEASRAIQPRTTICQPRAEEAAEDGNADRQSWSSTRTILVIALFAALLLSVGSFVTYPILQRKVEDLKKE